jgi:hypothetical protein
MGSGQTAFKPSVDDEVCRMGTKGAETEQHEEWDRWFHGIWELLTNWAPAWEAETGQKYEIRASCPEKNRKNQKILFSGTSPSRNA